MNDDGKTNDDSDNTTTNNKDDTETKPKSKSQKKDTPAGKKAMRTPPLESSNTKKPAPQAVAYDMAVDMNVTYPNNIIFNNIKINPRNTTTNMCDVYNINYSNNNINHSNNLLQHPHRNPFRHGQGRSGIEEVGDIGGAFEEDVDHIEDIDDDDDPMDEEMLLLPSTFSKKSNSDGGAGAGAGAGGGGDLITDNGSVIFLARKEIVW